MKDRLNRAALALSNAIFELPNRAKWGRSQDAALDEKRLETAQDLIIKATSTHVPTAGKVHIAMSAHRILVDVVRQRWQDEMGGELDYTIEAMAHLRHYISNHTGERRSD